MTHEPWSAWVLSPGHQSIRIESVDMARQRTLGAWLVPLPPEVVEAIEIASRNLRVGSRVELRLSPDTAAPGPVPVPVTPAPPEGTEA